ncbi:STY4851/ECs_5259 family protein [Tabrizicola sp. BL-A-41-H6]|uniref:STY4851/ECs_5259 family protein n=1 Tax=Tabrizicola sp. BL-A-41-H6 TaxID=3421107 RepID=UPI003D665723
MTLPPPLLAAGIDAVSGRPLHTYRLSSSSFAALQEMLQSRLPRAPKPLAHAMCFVIWAAEKFRRDFQGGSVSWSFLFEALKLPEDQAIGRELVAHGLAQFRRPAPRQTDAGTIYLKTLVAEGGLPEHLLTEAGRYRLLISALMQDIETLGAGAPTSSLRILAERRAQVLSAGFRTDEFHCLLADFANQLINLKGLCPKDLPTVAREAWLDAQRPGWRAALPLRIESAAAQSLLRDALKSDYQRTRREIVERSLVSVGAGKWKAQLSISGHAELPKWLLGPIPQGLRRFRLRPDLAMSEACPSLMLAAEIDDGTPDLWTVRRESGPRTAQFDFPLDRVAVFQMVADGRVIGSFTPPSGDGLSSEQMPTFWSMESADGLGRPQRLRRIGSTSVRTRAQQVWLLLGPGTSPKADASLSVEPAGTVGVDLLYMVSGSGYIFGSDGGWRFRVTTAADDDHVDRLICHGAVAEGIRDTQGGPVWRGCPAFMVEPAQGSVRAASPAEFLWRSAGQRTWRNGLPATNSLGMVQVGWKGTEGAVQAVEALRLVPQTLRLRTTSLPDGGVRVQVAGLTPGSLMSVEHGALVEVAPDGSQTIDVPTRQTETARLAILFFDPSSGQRLDATMSRPSDRGWIVAPGDRLLAKEEAVSLDELRGWRITLPQGRNGQLQLRLIDTNSKVSHQKVLINLSSEVAITAFLPLIRGLLAIGGPDSHIRLRLIVGQYESPRLVLRRFKRSVQWDGENLVTAETDQPRRPSSVALDEGVNSAVEQSVAIDPHPVMNVRCVNLSCPELLVDSHGITATTNIHAMLSADPGPWLVLPHDAGGTMRPARPIQTEASEASLARFGRPFIEAGSALTRLSRVPAFASALRSMTLPTAVGDAALFECLLDAVGDASDLAVLDQTLALAQTPEAAVLLVLRATPDRLGDRLALEDFSPFSWCTTPVSAWAIAIRSETARLSNMLLTMGLTDKESLTYADQQVSARLREVLLRRMDLAGQVILAAVQTGLFPKHAALFGRIPPGINAPAPSLLRLAREAVMRQEGEDQLFPELEALSVPIGFDALNPAMRGLIHTPLIVAEYATGIRTGLPSADVAIAILHFRTYDPAYFDAAVPAAIAWLAQGNA